MEVRERERERDDDSPMHGSGGLALLQHAVRDFVFPLVLVFWDPKRAT